jgi:hypothetical protein
MRPGTRASWTIGGSGLAIRATVRAFAHVRISLVADAAHPKVVPARTEAAMRSLTVVSNVRGEDPSFFAAVAAPSNLLILGGLIALAVALRRGGALPRLLAIGLPLSWVLTLALGGVFAPIAGAYWLAVGWMLRNGELPRPGIPATDPVGA